MKDRDDDGYGGICILCHRSLQYTKASEVYGINEVMTMGVKVHFPNKNYINIYNLYAKPNLNISTMEWNRLFDNLQEPFTLGGDFNCHNTAWGCDYTDPKEEDLLDSIEDKTLVLSYDGSATLLSTPNHAK